MSFDLRNQLSDLDKKIILNYITAFGDENGLPEEYFIGVDTFLENWAKSKFLFHAKKMKRDLRQKLEPFCFIIHF